VGLPPNKPMKPTVALGARGLSARRWIAEDVSHPETRDRRDPAVSVSTIFLRWR